jgi:hypothetical protein
MLCSRAAIKLNTKISSVLLLNKWKRGLFFFFLFSLLISNSSSEKYVI